MNPSIETLSQKQGVGTGDRAAFTKGVIYSFIEDGLRNIDQFAGGQRPKNAVNVELGY